MSRVVCGLSALIAFSVAAQSGVAQDLVSGKAIAKKLCADCHAIEKGGKSRLSVAPTFEAITRLYSVWSLQEALAEGIVTGHGDMPEFALDPDQIADLLTFMDGLSTPEHTEK